MGGVPFGFDSDIFSSYNTLHPEVNDLIEPNKSNFTFNKIIDLIKIGYSQTI